MIEVVDIHKSFGAVRAVRGVTFSAPDGAVTGLVGPNGAGKTTLLRLICTVLSPDHGRALVDGLDPADDPPAVQRRIGVLPHAHGLYDRLTPAEHIRYYGRLHGLSGRALAERVDELLDLLGMGAAARRRVAGFSQGETVKVALARALVHDPHNVILDEPTSGLDVMSTRKVRDLVRSLRDRGRCVLFSSHIMQEVAELCDRIVIIADGTITAAGTPDELRRQHGCDDLEEVFVRAVGDGAARDHGEVSS